MLENKKNLFFWGIVALIGAGLVLYGYFSSAPTLSPETGEIHPTELSGTPIPSPQSTPTEAPFAGLNGIKTPATCQVSGEANFSDSGLYSSNMKLSWQNIDSQGRLIKWRISPKDNLAIGPNLFANLTVPNGEYDNLTIRLPENPISKKYLLAVSVTYGRIIQGDVKIEEVDCAGQIKINLNF